MTILVEKYKFSQIYNRPIVGYMGIFFSGYEFISYLSLNDLVAANSPIPAKGPGGYISELTPTKDAQESDESRQEKDSAKATR